MLYFKKLVALALVIAGSGFAASGSPSFNDWKKRCDANIPHFKDVCKKSFAIHDFSKTATNYSECMEVVDSFIALNKKILSKATWIEENPFDTGSELHGFTPFTQAVRIHPGTKIVICGDRHGDVRSTLSMIDELSKKNYFDSENPFKLLPDVMLLALGDYVDRGNAGLETLLTMLLLKIHNPDQVILVRGNHEDCGYHVNKNQFQKEVLEKLGPAVSTADMRKINSIYDHMPVAVFIGAGGGHHSNPTRFMVGCHGFIEVGYHPGALLDKVMHKPIGIPCFEKMKELRRKDHLEKLSAPAVDAVKKLCSSCAQFDKETQPFTCTSPQSPSLLGWLWSYAIVDDGSKPIAFDVVSNTWQWGKLLTEQVLKYWSKPPHYTVSWIFRGHQHSHNEEYKKYPDIMHRLWEHNGLYKLWSASWDQSMYGKTGAFTVSVAPDNVYAGIIDQKEYPGFNYDTWVAVEAGSTFGEWNTTIHNKAMFALEPCPITLDGKKITPQKPLVTQSLKHKNIHNFYSVAKGKLYRCKLLPAPVLEWYIKKHNIKTIINLRQADPAAAWYQQEVALCKELGVTFYDLGFHPTVLPTKTQLAQLLKIFETHKDEAILVHCYAGADRTGLVCALWVAHQMNGTITQAFGQQAGFFNHNAAAFPHLKMFTAWWYLKKLEHSNDCAKILKDYQPSTIMDWVTLPEFDSGFLNARV